MTAHPRFLMIVSAYPPLKKAGMERGCQRLSLALARRGYKVSVLTQKTPDKPEVEQEAENLTIYRVIDPLAIGPLWGITYMTQVRRWALKLAPEYDVCLCQKLTLHSIPARAVCENQGKYYCNLVVNAGTFSDLLVLRRHKGGSILLRTALVADAHFYLSRVSRAELIAAGADPDSLYPFRYFVNMEAFAPSGEPPRREFLYMGRFHEQKNLPLLVEAFEEVNRVAPDVRLRLVGKGPDADTVREAVRRSPSRDAIEIAEWTDDPAAEYRRALAVVTASSAEGLSNVLVESMACGAPSVTTDVSGARDVLDPELLAPDPIPEEEFFIGKGGMIVRQGDAVGLARAMHQLLLDDDLRQRLAHEARSRVEHDFSEEVCVELFLAGVRKMIGRQTRR